MKAFRKSSHQRNSRIFYLSIALLIGALSITEISLSTVFLPDERFILESLENFRQYTFANSMIALKEPIVPTPERKVYETDAHCPYCRFDLHNQKGLRTCGKKIIEIMKSKRLRDSIGLDQNAATREAFRKAVVDSKDGACQRCDPASCTEKEKRYFRIDDVAPKVSIAITHYLHSIPKKHRIPKEALRNLTAYFSVKEHVHPARMYFFEFNPSIVKLPNDQKISSDAVYLASFRVSTCHNCIPDANDYMRMMNGPRSSVKKHVEYLGLAVLNGNLEIVKEIVVNVKVVMKYFQDPRLFVLNDQLFVGSYQNLRPLWLSPATATTNDTAVLLHAWPKKDVDDMEPNRLMDSIVMGKTGPCSTDRKTQKSGKNLHYFNDANNDTILEIQPMGPYERMNMNVACGAPLAPDLIQYNASSRLFPSFGTTDELDLSRQEYYDVPYTGDRGSACCATLDHPSETGNTLQLGISHSKTLYKYRSVDDPPPRLKSNQFFSSFYAFESKPPYKVVARSGKFCLGFSTESGSENPYTQMQMDSIKMIDVEYANCPRIHFVSGMVEKADDPDQLIVAYGINDCVPRMVVIHKSDVHRLLFTPHAIGALDSESS
jgi:hypothetical protein